MIRYLHFFLDLVFPCRCVSCGEPVLTRMNHLCGRCLGLLQQITDGCPVCSGVITDGCCSICSDRMFYPSANITLFRYDKTAKSVIHSLKFLGLKNIYKIIVPFIILRMREFNTKFDVITSVPMNRKKLVKRGYNQSKLIAKGVGRETGIEFCELLKEKRNFVQQRSLNYNERFINVIDRYETPDKTKIKDKIILLIDDVFTTGATVNECSRKLISSGAAEVFSVTVVRSDLKRLENI